MVRYYVWYSNKAKGQRRKEGMLRPGDKPPGKKDSEDFIILDVSDYEPPLAPSKTWRELIKKVWEVDLLTCPRCGTDSIRYVRRRDRRLCKGRWICEFYN